MPTIKADKLIARLERVKAELPKAIEFYLQQLGEKMRSDIATMQTYSYSSSWQRATHESSSSRNPYPGESYFRQPNDTFGYLDAIRQVQVNIQKNQMATTLNLGNIAELDELTMMDGKGKGYWRIFEAYGEYKRPQGTRMGGAIDHRFIPGNAGKRGQGIMTEGGSHPGVLPVMIFYDTYMHYLPVFSANYKGPNSLGQAIRYTFWHK